jgi:hypothetical protein
METELPFGKGRIVTYKHPSDTFYRSQIFVVDNLDENRFLNILYKHVSTGLSYDEQDHVLQSIKYRDEHHEIF